MRIEVAHMWASRPICDGGHTAAAAAAAGSVDAPTVGISVHVVAPRTPPRRPIVTRNLLLACYRKQQQLDAKVGTTPLLQKVLHRRFVVRLKEATLAQRAATVAAARIDLSAPPARSPLAPDASELPRSGRWPPVTRALPLPGLGGGPGHTSSTQPAPRAHLKRSATARADGECDEDEEEAAGSDTPLPSPPSKFIKLHHPTLVEPAMA
mmetsp:Transcript_12210/g.36761  ORF Transcript_12210/g.36761 Transcript_12210/m.36761 type:complete len:209 (-) Transcript_12210:168-794(-)